MGIHPKYALSICAGVGAFDLGLELAFPESVTACFIEREIAAIEILVARMEEGSFAPAAIHSDLLTFDGRPWRGIIHSVVAGLPCQPYSIAGKQLGHDDDRAIWPAFIRVVGEVQPEVVFLENVPAFLGFFRPVGDELQRMGYVVEEPLLLTASECGASHRRERFFAMAYRSRRGLRELRESSRRNGLPDRNDKILAVPEHQGSPRTGSQSRPSATAADIGRSGGNVADPTRDVGPGPDRETRGRRGVRKAGYAVGTGSLADDERSRCNGSAGQELHVCGRPLQATRSGDDGGPLADAGDGLLPEPGRGPEGRDGARSADPLLADPECSGTQREHEPGGARRGGTEPARDCAPVADTDNLGAERESRIVRGAAAAGETEGPERQRDGSAARHDSDDVADTECSQRRPVLECDEPAGRRVETADRPRSAGEPLGNTDDTGLEGRIERGCGLPDQRIAGAAGDPDVAHTGSKRRQQNAGSAPADEAEDGRTGWQQRESNGNHESCGSSADRLFAPGPGAVELWQRILSEQPWLSPALSTEEAQRILRRISSGATPELDFEDRTDRLRCLGNLAQSLQVATALTLLVKEACARANI